MRAAFVAALLFASAASAEPSVVGAWYEEATYGGSLVISVMTLNADGTYQTLFRRCLKPGEQDTVSVGHWTYANGTLRLTLEHYGISFGADEYHTESNDGRVWLYQAISGPNVQRYGQVRFRDTRVAPGAKPPTCDATS